MTQPLPRTVTLVRTGTVQVHVSGDHHCGDESVVAGRRVAVKYTVRLVVGPNDLDERGFLVDQGRLHTFMVDTADGPVAWREPCELLTFLWGYRLAEWVSTENTRCTIHELDLTLSPMPHLGAFTASFTAKPQPLAAAIPLRAVA